MALSLIVDPLPGLTAAGDDAPDALPMHGWVEGNLPRILPMCDLEPFFRAI